MGGAVFPPCCLIWGQTILEVMRIMATSFRRSHACTAALGQCPWPCSRPPLTHASTRGPWTLPGKFGSVSFGVTAPFFWVLVHKFFCVPSKSLFPQFRQLYGGVNSDLLQEGLCHTQLCCTQSLCLCGSPLLTRTSTGDTQTLRVRSGSVSVGSLGVPRVLFEPSKRLWLVWGLILNQTPWGTFFWWEPIFSCWWLFSRKL